MERITPKQQIEIIRSGTRKVLKSKESALQFLKDAGIYDLLPKRRGVTVKAVAQKKATPVLERKKEAKSGK